MKANALLTALAFMIILGVIKSKESSILASFFPPATSIRCFSNTCYGENYNSLEIILLPRFEW